MEYPSWVHSLTPPRLQPVTATVQPWMAVVCGDKTIKVPVRPGPEGLAEFKERVRTLFAFPPEREFEVSFECRAPVGGDKLLLKGIQCFDAAAHCATISAARRALGEEDCGFYVP
ncbi:hypothetical protein GPECTOR_14g193 [Gonium pectorale]|uniref:Uncharacterized protein n=1 Tax=Gonium pectorale TaxID=33097 RepID=A0A150GMB8_GONPE|nr:hypothetical protein GPECTOR_14g193 [Gonium pectorale]|eukprot:KXZ50947.1 hypothetical protein GPECTOR_14g193 [Gonium pectorale]